MFKVPKWKEKNPALQRKYEDTFSLLKRIYKHFNTFEIVPFGYDTDIFTLELSLRECFD